MTAQRPRGARLGRTPPSALRVEMLKICGTGRKPRVVSSYPPHTRLSGGGKYGKAEEKAHGPYSGVGADRAPVRLGRAEGVREDQAARPLRRTGPGSCGRDGGLRTHPLPEDRRLWGGGHGEPLRRAQGEAEGAAARHQKEDRGPQGRTPAAQP